MERIWKEYFVLELNITAVLFFLGVSEIENELNTYLMFVFLTGKLSIVPVSRWIEPTIDSEEERQAAERAQQMNVTACWV